MKSAWMFVLVACALLRAAHVEADECISEKPINPAYGLARGFGNIMSGWLELPRGIIYENARIPLVGFVAGPVKGAFLMTWREVAGVTDVLCMGLTGKGLYTAMVPDFVWDAHWLPQPREYKATAGALREQQSRRAPPCAQTPGSAPCSQHTPVVQPTMPPCGQPRETIVMDEVKLVEWTAPPAPAGASTPRAANATAVAQAAAPQTTVPANAAASTGPRRKVRVTIPFDLGPADYMDQRIKAMDARISEIEKRAGIWK